MGSFANEERYIFGVCNAWVYVFNSVYDCATAARGNGAWLAREEEDEGEPENEKDVI